MTQSEYLLYLYETCEQITNLIYPDNNDVESIDIISNNHGSVCIDVESKNFTYIGRFGDEVLGVILKTKCINNIPQKIACLSSVMFAYRDTGGFVFMSNMK